MANNPQTQIDRITGAVTTQKDLIAQVQAALEGKGGGSGGGSIDTCTVTIKSSSGAVSSLAYVEHVGLDEAGKPVSTPASGAVTLPYTFQAVCNTGVTGLWSAAHPPLLTNAAKTLTATAGNYLIVWYKLTAPAGGTAIFDLA